MVTEEGNKYRKALLYGSELDTFFKGEKGFSVYQYGRHSSFLTELPDRVGGQTISLCMIWLSIENSCGCYNIGNSVLSIRRSNSEPPPSTFPPTQDKAVVTFISFKLFTLPNLNGFKKLIVWLVNAVG